MARTEIRVTGANTTTVYTIEDGKVVGVLIERHLVNPGPVEYLPDGRMVNPPLPQELPEIPDFHDDLLEAQRLWAEIDRLKKDAAKQ